MKIIRPRTWAGFIKAIDSIRKEYGTYRLDLGENGVFEEKNQILFRGQSNHTWKLETTLERKTNKQIHILHYMTFVNRAVSEIESFTGTDWKVPDYPDLEEEIINNQSTFRVCLPAYDFLVYLRHHAFPSPLLDWTESPFIAAYFAYISATNKNPAVYCYIERPERVKEGIGGSPMITVKGPYVKTHKRHFAQKAWYTISTQWNSTEERHYFCPHENVFNQENPRQDLLIKIILPIKCRKEALMHLNDYNINHFTLFQSEDSLIKSIETKSFDINDV